MKKSIFVSFGIIFILLLGMNNIQLTGVEFKPTTEISTDAISIDGVIGTNEYTHSLVMKTSPYVKMYYNIIRGEIFMALEMDAKGWISVGYEGTGAMSGYDMITGGFDATLNQAYIFDAFGIGKVVPPPDGIQNINLFAASESSTRTILEFSRNLNTGDSVADKVLIPGKLVTMVWALHASSDDISIEHTIAGKVSGGYVFIGPPAAPSTLTKSVTETSVSLSWTPPAGDGGSPLINYKIYRSDNNGSSYVQVGTSTSTSYVDTTVTTGVIYYYKVTAVNNNGESGDSNVIVALPLGLITEPRSVSASYTSEQVTINWLTPTSTGGIPIHYNVYKSMNLSGPFLKIGTTQSTSFTDTPVLNGFTYYYYITSENIYNESLKSTTVSVTPIGVSSEPRFLSIINGDNSANLSWTKPVTDGGYPITQYKIYRSSDNVNFVNIGTNSSQTGFLDNGVLNSFTYYYYITSINQAGESKKSAVQRVTIANTPLPPTNLTKTEGDSFVYISWNPADGRGYTVLNYTVYKMDAQSGTFSLVKITSTNSYNDTGLKNGQTYVYQITANNSVGESGYSFQITGSPSTTPGQVQNLTVKSYISSIGLTWKAPKDDGGAAITHYNIYRSTDNSSFSKTKTTQLRYFLDKNVTPGTNYYYYVISVNKNGYGTTSPVTYIKLIGLPSNVTNLTGVFTGVSNVIKWESSVDTGGSSNLSYEIYRTFVKDSPPILIGKTSQLNYTDSDIIFDETYYYSIMVVNEAGKGDRSAYVGVLTSSIPDKPESLSILAGDKIIVLSWLPPQSNKSVAQLYLVYRAEGNGSFTNYANTTEFYFIDYNVKNNVSYSYHIIAKNQIGLSQRSDIVTGTPQKVNVETIQVTTVSNYKTIYYDNFDISAIMTTSNIFIIIGVFGAGIYVITKLK